jgi:Transposase zinc-binding domain
MSRPTLEVADLIRRHGEAFLQKHSTSREQRRVLRAIEQCRTAALGGHLYECDDCAHQSQFITLAATATVPSASLWPKPSGLKLV